MLHQCRAGHGFDWDRLSLPDNLWVCMLQTGVKLGVRLKAAWEWAALMGQVEVYGWQTFDVRYFPWMIKPVRAAEAITAIICSMLTSNSSTAAL